MTPKEKAEELFDYYYELIFNQESEYWVGDTRKMIVKLSIKNVDEIIEAIDWYAYEISKDQLEYWEEVKQTLTKLQ